MKLKIFQIICVFVFFISFGYFFGDEFWEYQKSQENTKIFQKQVESQSQEFSLEDIQESPDSKKLWVTPSKDFLKKLVSEIDKAKSSVYVEVYIFTERDLRDALIRAHHRGVEVKILLENNPYKAPYLNDGHHELFVENGVNVRWSDPLNYSLNHTKLLIIDDKSYVSTGNFSYSTFTKNRDIFVEIFDKEIVWKLKELFMLDFEHKQWGVFLDALVISPYSSRQKLEAMIASATESIDFYFPYMSDDWLEQVFSQAVDRGVNLRGVVSRDFVKEEGDLIRGLQNIGWDIRTMSWPKLHAKSILVDKKYLYIGSINFSNFSLDKNREIGIILSDQKNISDFSRLFESDL